MTPSSTVLGTNAYSPNYISQNLYFYLDQIISYFCLPKLQESNILIASAKLDFFINLYLLNIQIKV